ncbi:Major pollen allergen Bet v 1-B [Rhynchospora pubera]|uniref:Major pollen allergen Bet v 1-B n=1 Tax=Rhynchospora pubera TaxID=906938 RepID=A0AAV8CU29_9POAL|nr:Major pollen allergen Bet v 1-B [Rhynchospora pubera]
MKGSLCHEYETGIPAEEVWQVYGTLRVGQLVQQLLPHLFHKVEVVEGDGGVGTILCITFPSGKGTGYYKEKFIKVDNENYIKEAIGLEGGALEAGFSSYLVRIEIIPKDNNSSTIRSTIEYEVDDKCQVDASLISTDVVAAIADATTKYLKEQKNQVEG